MLEKRLIVCLDVKDGRTTKGIRFKENVDVGDPVAMALAYYEQGVDELVFYDITASAERRAIRIDTVRKVAENVFIPFSVGGGISTVEEMREVLLAGAEKVSVNSAAVRNPEIITAGARLYGTQCVVLGMDVARTAGMPCGYEVVIDGGRVRTGLDALEWAHKAERLGAGEIVLNSIDADGTKDGYELTITGLISRSVGVPVVASGGAGKPEHLVSVFKEAGADAALVASMVHYGEWTVGGIKGHLARSGIPVRATPGM
ncbi:MAG TPA: imidazole glycerol phosphate synthase subunit HisF [Spirochaetia bacterium]|nr:imidazole glycerol phosphate synthase subunit HisF [Spirochaetia bacterium]